MLTGVHVPRSRETSSQEEWDPAPSSQVKAQSSKSRRVTNARTTTCNGMRWSTTAATDIGFFLCASTYDSQAALRGLFANPWLHGVMKAGSSPFAHCPCKLSERSKEKDTTAPRCIPSSMSGSFTNAVPARHSSAKPEKRNTKRTQVQLHTGNPATDRKLPLHTRRRLPEMRRKDVAVRHSRKQTIQVGHERHQTGPGGLPQVTPEKTTDVLQRTLQRDHIAVNNPVDPDQVHLCRTCHVVCRQSLYRAIARSCPSPGSPPPGMIRVCCRSVTRCPAQSVRSSPCLKLAHALKRGPFTGVLSQQRKQSSLPASHHSRLVVTAESLVVLHVRCKREKPVAPNRAHPRA